MCLLWPLLCCRLLVVCSFVVCLFRVVSPVGFVRVCVCGVCVCGVRVCVCVCVSFCDVCVM